MQPPFVNREFWYLAPEMFLTAWGLIVLILDFGPLRKAPSARRNRILGLTSLLGVFLTLVPAILALLPTFGFLGISLDRTLALGLAESDYTLFSGTIAADPSTAFMNLLLLTMLALVVGLSMAWDFTEYWGEYYSLLLWATVGMMFLIAAEELITLFLTLETMTLCLYMMTSLEKSKRRSAEGGLKYFVYGSVSSALFLYGLSLIYGLTGTTTLPGIRSALASGSGSGLQGNFAGATALLLVMVGLGFKIAAVPFHQWAPDTYEGAPAPVSAWIAAGSKVASFVALMKLLLYALPYWASAVSTTAGSGNFISPGWIGFVAVISAATMTFGNFAALAQKNLKRMLAYSSIAHAGYMLVGVLAAAVSVDKGQAAGSVLFYLVVYGFGTVGAFAVAVWLAKDKGSDNISDLNGLGFRYPAMAVCIVLLMLSLIGMPPLAGFFGKLYMFMEAMNSGERHGLTLQWLVMLGLFNSVVSAFYYVRVLKAMFLRAEEGPPMKSPPSGVLWSITLATLVSVGFGIYPDPLIGMMKGAALPMLSPGARITTASNPDPTFTEADAQKLRDEAAREADARGLRVRGVGPQLKDKSQGNTSPPKAPSEPAKAQTKKDGESK